MKINEVITESEQLDELSAMDVARGVGSAVGKTAHAAGAVAGGLKGAWDAGKAGYQQGLSFTGGQRVGRTTPKASSAPSGNLDAMADQDLVAMKGKIDSILTARQASGESPQAGAEPQGQSAQLAANKPVRGQMANVNGKDYMFAGNMWVDEKNNPAKGEDLKQIKSMFARGEIGPPPTERPGTAQTQQSAKSSPVPDQKKLIQALSKLTPDQVETVRSMLAAKVQGQQNVAEGIGDAIKAGWNKLTGRGGLSFDQILQAIEQMPPQVARGLLDQLPAAPAAKGGAGLPGLTAPTLQPKPTGNVTTSLGGTSTPGSITTGGVSRPGAASAAGKPAPKSAATAPAASSPYGNLTPDEQKFVASREKEGVEPEIIKQALAARKQRKPVGAPAGGPEKTQAKRTTDYDWYEKGGVNPNGTLRNADPASFAAAQAKKQAANEGFYSKFLDKKI